MKRHRHRPRGRPDVQCTLVAVNIVAAFGNSLKKALRRLRRLYAADESMDASEPVAAPFRY